VTDTVSTDPETHSTHLDGLHIPLTIEPGDEAVSCHICYERYKAGAWRLLLPEARNRSDHQLHMCRRCAEAIGVAAARFPTTPAPWVDYS